MRKVLLNATSLLLWSAIAAVGAETAKPEAASVALAPAANGESCRIVLQGLPCRYELLASGKGVGMPSPTQANWYHEVFLYVEIDGKVFAGKLQRVSVVRPAPEPMVDVVWGDERVLIRARFVASAGQRALLTEVAADMPAGIGPVKLILLCYPSAFAKDPPGQQYALSVTGKRYEQGKGFTAELPAENGFFFGNAVYDPERGRGSGGCAFVAAPGGIGTMTVELGGYAAFTRLTVAPGANSWRLAFWDFTGLPSNRAAEAEFNASVAPTATRLASTDWRNHLLAGLSPEKMRAEGAALSPSVTRQEALTAYRQAETVLLAALSDWDRALTGTGRPTHTEETALRLLTDYDNALWELRFAALGL